MRFVERSNRACKTELFFVRGLYSFLVLLQLKYSTWYSAIDNRIPHKNSNNNYNKIIENGPISCLVLYSSSVARSIMIACNSLWLWWWMWCGCGCGGCSKNTCWLSMWYAVASFSVRHTYTHTHTLTHTTNIIIQSRSFTQDILLFIVIVVAVVVVVVVVVDVLFCHNALTNN